MFSSKIYQHLANKGGGNEVREIDSDIDDIGLRPDLFGLLQVDLVLAK